MKRLSIVLRQDTRHGIWQNIRQIVLLTQGNNPIKIIRASDRFQRLYEAFLSTLGSQKTAQMATFLGF